MIEMYEARDCVMMGGRIRRIGYTQRASLSFLDGLQKGRRLALCVGACVMMRFELPSARRDGFVASRSAVSEEKGSGGCLP